MKGGKVEILVNDQVSSLLVAYSEIIFQSSGLERPPDAFSFVRTYSVNLEGDG